MAGLSGLPFAVVARQILLLLIFSLAFTQPAIPLLGLAAIPTDFIYLALVAAWLGAIATRQIRIGWNRVILAVGLYFGSMTASLLVSADAAQSGIKLLTQIYLLSLPIIASSLIRSEKDLRRALFWWLAGTLVVVILALLSLILFFAAPTAPLLAMTVNEFGTLPPGPYPRLRVTFMIGNLLCNYLTVALMILFAVRQRRWMGEMPFLLLAAAVLISAFFTLSPGLGGILLALGLWLWLAERERRPRLAAASLAAGAAGAALFVAVMSVTPIIHPTAPFLIRIPTLDLTLAPSVRLMIWIDAARNFLTEPWLGRGIGMDAVRVHFMVPSGDLKLLTDAHNSFLSIAVQCGIPGLAAFLFLLWAVASRIWSATLDGRGVRAPSLWLGLAFLNGLAYQGLGGSFEDARHLWVLLGLFIAAGRIETASDEARFTRPPERAGVPAHS